MWVHHFRFLIYYSAHFFRQPKGQVFLSIVSLIFVIPQMSVGRLNIHGHPVTVLAGMCFNCMNRTPTNVLPNRLGGKMFKETAYRRLGVFMELGRA